MIFITHFSDNQEIPRSISLESSSSLESLVSENEELENERISLSQTVLRPVSSTSVLLSAGSGAFTSYVRKRGEPDGRTAITDSTSSSVKVTNLQNIASYFIYNMYDLIFDMNKYFIFTDNAE